MQKMDAEFLFQRRRKSGWRERVRTGLEAISKPLAKGLLIHFSKRMSVQKGAEALEAMSPEKRRQAWKVIFPGMAAEVENTWGNLSPEMIAQRDGGYYGTGELYRWKLSDQQASGVRFEWLRKLTIAVGPFPELNFAQALAEAELISSGRQEESDEDHFETTGHCYDSDALGYMASVILNAGDNLSSPEVESFICQNISVQIPRHLKTACLCSTRPDLWEELNQLIVTAQSDQIHEILGDRLGGRSGGLIGLLNTIHSNGLTKNENIRYFLSRWQGVNLGWSRQSPAWFQKWLGRLLDLLESRKARDLAWRGDDPMEQLNSLWAGAVHDADEILSLIARPDRLTENQTLAAVHFLQSCPGRRRAVISVAYASHPNLTIASAGLSLLVDEGSALPTSSEVPDFFDRMLRSPLLKEDSNADIPRILPFPKPKAAKNEVLELLAERFPDGAEGKIEALLPQMKKEVRDSVVTRLNRYSLTTHDEFIAKIMHGGDPDIWADWLADHEGSQEMAQRHLLFKMMGDRSLEVAEHAFKAVKKFSVTAEEFPLIRPLLKSKSAKRNLFATRLISTMAVMPAEKILATLLKSSNLNERLCGLEVIRVWSEDGERSANARKIWKETDQAIFTSNDELRAIGLFRGATKHEDADDNSLTTAFGLVSPEDLPSPEEKKTHDVIIFSDTTEAIVAGLAAWLEGQQGTKIRNPDRWIKDAPERVPLTSGNLPYYSQGDSEEKNFTNFPAARGLKEWWTSRPSSMRDHDGMELVRLKIAAKSDMLGSSRMNYVGMMALFGRETPFSHPVNGHDLNKLVTWLTTHFPAPLEEARYCFKAAQTLFLQLPPKQRNWTHKFHEIVRNFIYANPNADPKFTESCWASTHHPISENGHLRFMFYEVIRLFRHGYVKPQELIWSVVGDRDIEGYSRERAFNDLASLTTPSLRNPDFENEKTRQIARTIVSRIIELELRRGEESKPSSLAALAIKTMHGAENLAACLRALGKDPLKRNTTASETRPAVLNHLISVSSPADSDTAETFAKAVKAQKIPTARLIEVAVLRPQWSEWIGESLGESRLKDAVSWIFAHARSPDFIWEANGQALWEGDLASVSELRAEQLLAGVVDIKWFQRCYREMGKRRWCQLIASSKFVGSGRGHARVQLYSDALTGKISAPSLIKFVNENSS